MEPRRYPYHVPWRGVAVSVLGFALSVVLAHWTWGAEGCGDVCLAASAAMFGVLGLGALTRRLVFPCALELTDDAVLLPNVFVPARVTRIPYADIIRMQGGGCIPELRLGTASGSYSISALRLPDRASFEAVKEFICSQASIVMSRDEGREPSAWWMWEGDPEPTLSWTEPEDWPRYRASLVAASPLLPRLLKALRFFAVGFGFFLLPWFVVRLCELPTLSIASFFSVVTPAALFITSIYWLYAKSPVRATRISFREHGISLLSGKQTWDVGYPGCMGWNVVERQYEGRTLHIVLIRGGFEAALPDAGTRDRLVQLLHDKRIPHSPDIKPSWEPDP